MRNPNVEVIADPEKKQAAFVVTYHAGNKEYFSLTYDEGCLIIAGQYIKVDGEVCDLTRIGIQPIDRNCVALYLA